MPNNMVLKLERLRELHNSDPPNSYVPMTREEAVRAWRPAGYSPGVFFPLDWLDVWTGQTIDKWWTV